MKKVAILTALCGLIFAGISATCNACPNWGRFLPRPIVIPADSSSISNDIIIAGIDFRKYFPRPIVIPADSFSYSAPIELAVAPVAKDPPPYPWVRKTLISALPVAKDPPPFPWVRKTLTA